MEKEAAYKCNISKKKNMCESALFLIWKRFLLQNGLTAYKWYEINAILRKTNKLQISFFIFFFHLRRNRNLHGKLKIKWNCQLHGNVRKMMEIQKQNGKTRNNAKRKEHLSFDCPLISFRCFLFFPNESSSASLIVVYRAAFKNK